MKKKIIIGVPTSSSLNEEIVKNLEFLGFEVLDVSFDFKPNFKYKRFTDRAYNFIRKVFLRDTSYKKKLRFEEFSIQFKKQILAHQEFDYALFIRPDLYPIDFVKYVKKHSKKMVGYQWDGMDRFPEIKKYTKLFDRFFVFDKADLKGKFLPLTNFYFDYNLPENIVENQQKNVYFVGSFFRNRIALMKKMAKSILKSGFISNINVFTNKEEVKEKHQTEGIHFMEELIDYRQNLKNVENSTVLVDFLNNVHNGQSLRTFEALGYQKKLITNNIDIVNYDFYNENNIFVFNESNIDDIEEFLKKPYQKIDDNIRKKYSFTNWIHYVLDIEPYQKIEIY